uniref:Serpin 1 n=1 Tax=Manduca sexta TaxID=7130 RepID=Q25496_MANSE|nr:serpin 1 [Manduca sexta]
MKIIMCIFGLAALAMAGETDLQKILRESNDQFTAQMFSEVVKANPGQNVVLSAFSVLPPLGQLALASVGESHDELLRALALPNDNVTKDVFADLNRGVRAVKGVDLKMASKIYVAKGLELNDDFAAVSRDVFGSEVQNVDFVKSVEAAGAINKWVEDQTNNRIKNLVDPDALDETTRSVLVNAIYFKGSWKDKFVKERTMDRDFHVSKDKTIKVPTMIGKKDVRYADVPELDAKMIEMSYEGDQASMIIILPNQVDGITALEQKLKDPKALSRAEERLYNTEVEIYLPKFKIETTTDLKEVLSNMNIKKLFTPGAARLENLLKTKESLYVDAAIQKAFIEVNEEGAEAAAANAFFIVGITSIQFEPPVIEFHVNRPFFFNLKASGQSLFNGICVQP